MIPERWRTPVHRIGVTERSKQRRCFMTKQINPFDYGMTVEDVSVLAVLHRPKAKRSIEQEIEREVRI